MQLRSLGIAFLVMTTLLFAGCRTSPVYNISNTPVTVSDGSPTESQIAKAIITAGNSLGWSIKKEAPGKMIGTLHLRKHIAVVDISYSRDNYSITYKDSTNLKYNGTVIHSNYNGWIENLDNAIKVQLNNI
jgi:hypothetical protein